MSSSGSSSYIIDDDQSRLEMNSLFAGSNSRHGIAPKPFSERNLPASFYRHPAAEQWEKGGIGHHIKNQASLPDSLVTTSIDRCQTLSRSVSDSAPLSVQSAVSSPSLTFNSTQFTKLPLPDAWEERRMPDGSPYFLDHATRTTTWIDPRPSHYAAFQSFCATLPLPSGHVENRSAHGQTYFVDQINKRTLWDDPRPNHYRVLMTRRLDLPSTRSPTSEENVVAKELWSISKEREAITQRIRELDRKEADMWKKLNHPRDANNHYFANSTAPQASTGNPLSHTRQSSIDSGLGDGYPADGQAVDIFADFDESILFSGPTVASNFLSDNSHFARNPPANWGENQSQSQLQTKSSAHTHQ